MPKPPDPLADLLRTLKAARKERLTDSGRACIDAALYCVTLAEAETAGYARAQLMNVARGWLNSAFTSDDKAETVRVAEALAKLEGKRTRREKLGRLQ